MPPPGHASAFSGLAAATYTHPATVTPSSSPTRRGCPRSPGSWRASRATPGASPSPSATVLVHVLGEVRKPGVVSLPDGARVQDAIAAAGALLREDDRGEEQMSLI